jgi:hypothetical protein
MSPPHIINNLIEQDVADYDNVNTSNTIRNLRGTHSLGFIKCFPYFRLSLYDSYDRF